MKRSLLAAVTIAFVVLPTSAQDPMMDARQATLKASFELTSKGIDLKGTVNMPDNTALRCAFSRQVERVAFTKIQCTVYTEWCDSPPLIMLDVKRKAFAKMVEGKAPGVYQYMITYSKMAQRYDAVKKELGAEYRNWSSTFSAAFIDHNKLLKSMEDDRPTIEGFITKLKSLVDAAERELQKTASERNFTPIEKDCDATEKKIVEFQENSYYTATPFVLITGINKVRGCAPSQPKLGYEPGTPEGEHAAGGQPDIPELVNETWQMELCRAFVGRARYTMERERLIIPFNCLVASWDMYLNAIKVEETVGAKYVDDARDAFNLATEVTKTNAKEVDKDLPDEKRRNKDQERYGKWAAGIPEIAVKMEEYAKLRRGARSIEEAARMESEDQKVVRNQVDALSQEIRTMPPK